MSFDEWVYFIYQLNFARVERIVGVESINMKRVPSHVYRFIETYFTSQVIASALRNINAIW